MGTSLNRSWDLIKSIGDLANLLSFIFTCNFFVMQHTNFKDFESDDNEISIKGIIY